MQQHTMSSITPIQPEATEALILLERLERIPRRTFHLKLGALLGGGLLLNGLDTVMIAIVLTAIMTTFHVNQAVAGLLIGAGYLGQALGTPIIGSLAEQYGRKKLSLFSLLVMGFCSLLAAVAPTITWLFVARLVQGIGLGGCAPVTIALFTEFLPRTKRGRSASQTQALYALGFVLAPVLALLLSSLVGPLLVWRLLVGIGALPVLIAAVAVTFVPESVRWQVLHGRSEDAETTVEQLEQKAHHAYRMVPMPRHASELPVVPQPQTRFRELFAPAYRQRTLLLWIQWFAAAFLLVGFSSWLPTLYVQLAGLSPLQAQLLTIFLGIVVLLCLMLSTVTVDKRGRTVWFLIGFALSAFGAVLGAVSFGLLHNTSAVLLAVSGMTTTVGGYLCVIGNVLSTAERYPTRMRSWALSLGKRWSAIASIIAPLSIGLFTNHIGSIFLLFGSVALIAFLGGMVLAKETQPVPLETLTH
jgi:MFS transporter, putative metabolite:H+ symporter